MAADEIVNEDFEITVSNQAGPGGASPTGDDIEIDIGEESNGLIVLRANKAEAPQGKKIIKAPISYVWVTCPMSFTGWTFISGGGAIVPTITKVKCDGQVVHKLADIGPCAGSWWQGTPQNTKPCACTLEITKSDQQKVKGE